MYFYLRLSVDVWPPPGVPPLRLTLPTLALIPLLLSASGLTSASEGAKKNNRRGCSLGWCVNLVLALIFLVLRFAEWRTFNFTWASDIHGTLVWSILFLHTFDVVADLMMTAVLIVILATGTLRSEAAAGRARGQRALVFPGADLVSAVRGGLLGPASGGVADD